MKRQIYLNSFLLFLTLGVAEYTLAQPNDHMFPPAAEAKSFIDFDKKGFLVNGKRTFIVSANMEYSRVPRELWRDRLIRLKRAGFNAIEMYTFWNYHEPKEGEYDFSGDQDLDAYLKLIKELGMYSIVRIGPYYCGEWSMGGYPVWLKFKPGLRVREDNPQFLAAVDKFYDKLIPIVSSNQINNGGSVILVQIENEFRLNGAMVGWGTNVFNSYFKHLQDKTLSLGLKVPYYFSGMHPGNDPASNKLNLDDPERPSPWFSAEYWGVWFFVYGSQPADSAIYDRRTWKIIAHGGNGYNVYMAHGGTNFDYNNSWDVGTSYDYGAAVGQAGDLRPIYFSYKRAAWFARSFQDILQNSSDAGSKYHGLTSDTTIMVTGRDGPAGNIVFFDNPGKDSLKLKINVPSGLQIPGSQQIELAPGEIMPIVNNYKLSKDVKIVWAPTRIYNVVEQGNTTTLILYGQPESPALLYFDVPSATKMVKGNEHFRMLPGGSLEFSSKMPSAAPEEYVFEVDGRRIRILTVNNQMAQRTWLVEGDNKTNIIIGPNYAAEANVKENKLSLAVENSWEDTTKLPFWLYKESGEATLLTPISAPDKRINDLKLTSWEIKNASEPILPSYDDTQWKKSPAPLQMGADGDISANAWYRAKVKVPQSGTYTLQIKKVLERATVFLDGKRIGNTKPGDTTLAVGLNLRAGVTHSIAIFSSHIGRRRLIYFNGDLNSTDLKGVTGPVTLKKTGQKTVVVGPWRMKGGPGDADSKTGWRPLLLSDKKNSPQFYRTTFILPELKGTEPMWRVNFTSLSAGSIWVNGHNLGRYPERIRINGLYIPESWLHPGNNTLVIFDENGLRPDKVVIQAEIAASRDETIFSESVR